MPLAHTNIDLKHLQSLKQRAAATCQNDRHTPPISPKDGSDQERCSNASGDLKKNLQQPSNGSEPPRETSQQTAERLKKERSPTWLEDYCKSLGLQTESASSASTTTAPTSSKPRTHQSSGFEPISESPEKEVKALEDRLELGSSIERPRSALHSGDFRQRGGEHSGFHDLWDSPRPPLRRHEQEWLSTSPTTPWYTSSIAPLQSNQRDQPFASSTVHEHVANARPRRRAASYSARSTSFVFRPPTSPLAIESSNEDPLDLFNPRGRPDSPSKANRRRTFSPRALSSMQSRPFSHGVPPASSRALPNLRREGTYPYQAHQPRRSLNSAESLPSSISQSPGARSRRPSVASETSPLQRLPMVGRYEESILRGRMSSVPSRPLDFVAQIGVLGKGQCRSSLMCPPHVAVPFPAVFYDYGSRPGSEGPSPYVGMIDLENFLKSNDRPATAQSLRSESPASDTTNHSTGFSGSPARRRRRRKARDANRRRSGSPRVPPKGSYRIPQQGQLQIIIKNPHKTAVKLFLVPYDLAGMEAGQKTFIRQRSYSAGPIIDMPSSSRTNLGTDRPEAAITNSEDPKDRPVLRYLIHLNVCCPTRGRFYLYKSIRVVFANRVPDGREKLRQEIQLPDPKFSPYRPKRDLHRPQWDTPGHQASGSISPLPISESPTDHALFSAPLPSGKLVQDENRPPAQSVPFTFPSKDISSPLDRSHSPLSREQNDAYEPLGRNALLRTPSPMPPLSREIHEEFNDENKDHTRPGSPGIRMRALYDYDDDDENTLVLKQGDIVLLLTATDGGWWDGWANGIRAWFPRNYCEFISETKVPRLGEEPSRLTSQSPKDRTFEKMSREEYTNSPVVRTQKLSPQKESLLAQRLRHKPDSSSS